MTFGDLETGDRFLFASFRTGGTLRKIAPNAYVGVTDPTDTPCIQANPDTPVVPVYHGGTPYFPDLPISRGAAGPQSSPAAPIPAGPVLAGVAIGVILSVLAFSLGGIFF
jgi:hypothetical protein